jgi:hypothetical protein
MEHERQIAADWLISVDFADTFAQGRKSSGDIVRGGPALDRRRAFDPVERAGYEAAEASA